MHLVPASTGQLVTIVLVINSFDGDETAFAYIGGTAAITAMSIQSAISHQLILFSDFKDPIYPSHMLRRYSPPTSYSAWLICPRLWVFTASIKEANTFRRSRAVACNPRSPAPANPFRLPR